MQVSFVLLLYDISYKFTVGKTVTKKKFWFLDFGAQLNSLGFK